LPWKLNAQVMWQQAKGGVKQMKQVSLELQSRTAAPTTAAAARSWATDFAPLLPMGKIVVASGERELWFYELRTMQPAFVLTRLEETPLRLDCCYDEQMRATIVVVGDHKGTLSAFTFPEFYHSSAIFKTMGGADPSRDVLRLPVAQIQAGGVDLGGVTYTRWAVHDDWVTGLIYAKSLRTVISASNDPATALVVGDIIRPAITAPRTLDIDPDGDMA